MKDIRKFQLEEKTFRVGSYIGHGRVNSRKEIIIRVPFQTKDIAELVLQNFENGDLA